MTCSFRFSTPTSFATPRLFSRALAEHLAGLGIAPLRFAERGTGASGGDYVFAGFDTEYDDDASALGQLAALAEVDPDWLTGRLFRAMQRHTRARLADPETESISAGGLHLSGRWFREYMTSDW